MKNMSKLVRLALLVCLCAALMCLGAAAAERTVYVSAAGTGDGSSADAPIGSLENAVDALGGEGGRIVCLSVVPVNRAYTVPEQSGDLTLTAENGGGLLLFGNLSFAKNENANLVTLDLPMTAWGEIAIFGGFNNLHFTENCVMSAALDFFGGVETPEGLSTVSGNPAKNRELNAQCVTELPYSITVDNGNFATFAGGSRRLNVHCLVGSIAAPVEITINGGTFGKGVSFTQNSLNKNENAISISGMGILADDATLTIHGGVFNSPIYMVGRGGVGNSRAGGCSIITMSDSKYYAMDGDITLNITGGTFNGFEISAYQNGVGYTQLLRGNFNVNISGNPTFAAGTVIDATQVKAYAGETKLATLNYDASAFSLTAKRFDVVNGASMTYDEPLRIACIGDSITQGTGAGGAAWDFETKAYPAQLLALIEQNGGEALLGNYGIGGATTMPTGTIWYNDMLPYVLTMEETDADYFIIGLGTNDAYNTGRTDGQLARFETMYADFIAGYGNLPTTQRVFTTSALYRFQETAYSGMSAVCAVANIRTLQRSVTETLAATSDKYVFVDLYALTFDDAVAGKLLAGDRLHPNAAGYQNVYAPAIYNAVFNGVTEVEGFSGLTEVYVSDSGTPGGAGTADDPISMLANAYAKLAPGSDATVYIKGTLTYDGYLTTPIDLNSISFVGVGTDATLALTDGGKLMRFHCDTKIDNLKLTFAGSGALYVSPCYNNFEITDSVTIAPNCMLIAGHAVYGGDEFYRGNPVASKAAAYYDSAEAVSDTRDCTITLNGGKWMVIIGGNWRFAAHSPIGTYSGNMTLNIGGNAQILDPGNTAAWNGAVGMNYLTGSVAVNVNVWKDGVTLRDYANVRSLDGVVYDPTLNTGSVTVNAGDGVPLTRAVALDFDGDGVFNLRDSLVMLGQLLNGTYTASANYFDSSSIALRDVIWTLSMIQ